MLFSTSSSTHPVCNLLAAPAAKEKLRQGSAIHTLIQMLADPEADCLRFAAMAITNLSTSAENQLTLVQQGTLPPLLAIAGSPGESASYALMALCNLATHRHNRVTLVQAGGLGPVASAAESGQREMVRAAALLLCRWRALG